MIVLSFLALATTARKIKKIVELKVEKKFPALLIGINSEIITKKNGIKIHLCLNIKFWLKYKLKKFFKEKKPIIKKRNNPTTPVLIKISV